MLIHAFAFRWAKLATPADRRRAAREIAAFDGRIDGLIEIHVGPNIARNGRGFETAGMMRFTDASAFQAYQDHPLHTALLAWLAPLIEPVEIDLNIPAGGRPESALRTDATPSPGDD